MRTESSAGEGRDAVQPGALTRFLSGKTPPAAPGRIGDPPLPVDHFVPDEPTLHFQFFHWDTLGQRGQELAEAMAPACEQDYAFLQKVFPSVTLKPDPDYGKEFLVYLQPGSSGAGHADCLNPAIYVDVFDENHLDLLSFLLCAEMAEVFMAYTKGWDCAHVNGEALSRVLAAQRYPAQMELPDLGIRFTTVWAWLDGGRPHFISRNDGADTDPVAVGCGVLFLHWLNSQLGYSWPVIAASGEATLALTYQDLLMNGWNAFDQIYAAAEEHYPPRGWSYELAGDNPFLGWQAVAPAPFSAVFGASPEPYLVDVFTRDAVVKGTLLHRWFDGTNWSPELHWEDVGYPVDSPAVIGREGRTELVGTIDGQVYWLYQDAATSAWLAVPVGLSSNWPVAACVWDDKIDVFAISSDASASLMHISYDGSSWSTKPDDLGLRDCALAPSAVRWSGRVDVAVASTHSVLSPMVCHKTLGTDTWDYLQGISLAVDAGPHMVSWQPGLLDIVVRDADNQLRRRYFDGDSWGGRWEDPFAANVASEPNATASAVNRIDVVWAGRDPVKGGNVVFHQFWDGDSWGTGLSMNLPTTSPVLPVSRGSGLLDVIAIGTDRTIYHNRWA